MKKLKFLVLFCILTFAISCGQQKKFIEYTVKDGETMRSIAKKLDMKTKDLLRLNPDVGRRPDTNTVILIPNSDKVKALKIPKKEEVVDVKEEKEEKQPDEVVDETEELKKLFVLHKVKKGDTFYSLTRFYNVSETELKKLNPELIDGLKLEQVIKIKPITSDEDEDANKVYEDFIESRKQVKVAMLLPFRATEYDSLSSKDIFKSNRLANIVTDFYMGSEIAIDSLKSQGVDIQLSVFDTKKKNSIIRDIIRDNNLNDNDVIIGPFYSDEAKIVANKVNIPVVFPVYSKSQRYFSSSRLIKTSPDKKIYKQTLIDYIENVHQNENIIIVGDGKPASNFDKRLIKEELLKVDSIQTVYELIPEKGYIKKDRFIEVLKPNTTNWVIVASDDKVIVADAINSLISLPEDTNVKLFAIENTKSYTAIDNDKLAKIGFTYVSDVFIDENAFSTQVFNKKYFAKNNALPSDYATKGFDITYDILIRLASGDDLKDTFKKGASYRVESKFDFSKKLFNTSENNGLFIVQFNKDLSLTRLK